MRIEILDISDKFNPQQISATPLLGSVTTDLIFVDNVLYVIGKEGLLTLIDVSDPAYPVILGTNESLGYPESIALYNNYAIVASGGAGLRIIDLSNTAALREVSYIYTNGYAYDIQIVDTLAYIACGEAGLSIFDLSNPLAPKEIGNTNTPGIAQAVEVVGMTAFLADNWTGLRIIDVSNPEKPRELGHYDTPGQAIDITISGSHAFVADAFKGICMIDISNIAAPYELKVYDSGSPVQHVNRVIYGDGVVFLADDEKGFGIVDFSAPGNPIVKGFYLPLSYAEGITVQDHYAYVASGYGGLQVIDISNPEQPLLTASSPTTNFATRITTKDSYAYIANLLSKETQLAGITIFDISVPENPIEISHFMADRGPPRDLAVQDSIAYFPNEWGMQLVDISNPYAPFEVATLQMEAVYEMNTTVGIDVAYPFAYVVQDSGLTVVDVSDPANLNIVGSFPRHHWPLDVTINGNVAYYLDGGLFSLDITNPAEPTQLDYAEAGGLRLSIDQNVAYIASYPQKEVIAVDISDPADMQILDRQKTLFRAMETAVMGDYLYVADADGGVLVFKIVRNDLKNLEGKYSNNSGDTLWVYNSSDSGVGSFRDCLEQIDEGQTILFDSAVFPQQNPTTISLFSALPMIGAHNSIIDASNAGVIINGENLSGHNVGLHIEGQHIKVHGFQIINFSSGVEFTKNSEDCILGGNRSTGTGPAGMGNVICGLVIRGKNNVVVGNLIGTDVTGSVLLNGPNNGNEVGFIEAENNRIGGLNEWERNIIAGGLGMGSVEVFSNKIIGNYIGIDITGTSRFEMKERTVSILAGTYNNLIQNNLIGGNLTVSDPGTSYNTIIGNIVGLNASGSAALGGPCSIGADEPYNRIGGTEPAERNVVAGSGMNGIGVGKHSVFVLGNYIGTDITGTIAIGNNRGIFIGGEHHFIGGATENERNIISGNSVGINLSGDYHYIAGNFIGIDKNGFAMGNSGQGVNFERGSHNYIGPNNRIMFNQESGIDISGNTNRQNVISRNAIAGNGGKGIALTDGSNEGLAAPILNQTTQNTVSGTAEPNAYIEIFSDPEDEGFMYEGTTRSDSLGNFTFTLEKGLAGPNITATATDTDGNTSEFSSKLQGVNLPPFLVQPINDVNLNEDFGNQLISSNLYDFFSDTPSEAQLIFTVSSSDSTTQPVVKNDSLFISSVLNIWGEDTIVITASDLPGLSVKDTFFVQINPINDVPEFINLPDTLAFAHNSSDSLFIWDYIMDPETPDSLLAFEFYINSDSLIIYYNSTSGYLMLSAHNGYYRQTILAISVTDDSAAVASDSLLVLVNQPSGIQNFTGQIPKSFKLYQNYPNPFNPETTILFDLPRQGHVKVEIYNIMGQRTRTLVDEIKHPGSYKIVWDAKNDNGNIVSSGVYFVKFVTKKIIKLKKVLFLQ